MSQNCLRRQGAVCMSMLLLLLPVPTLAGPGAAPVGTAHGEGTFLLDGQIVRTLSVVYSGDQLRTEKTQASVNLQGGSLVVLGQESSVRFMSAQNATGIALEKGRLALSTPPKSSVHVLGSGLRFAPSATVSSLAELTLRADGSLIVAVHRGGLAVSDLREKPVEIAAGQVLTVNPRLGNADNGSGKQGESQAGSAQTEPVGTGAHGKMTLGEKLRTFRIGGLSHGASVALMVGILGGTTAAAIAIPLTVGDEEPISPSQP